MHRLMGLVGLAVLLGIAVALSKNRRRFPVRAVLAPERRQDLSRLSLRALIGGRLATFMTATIAGMLV